jgi:zinc transport system permease protein
MTLDFISKALLAGGGIALIAGPLGSLIVWRRMANFGDALSHSTLLGVCFAFLLNINLYIGLIAISLLMAAFLAVLSRQKQIANDTLLSVLSATALSIGLILATLLKEVRIDLLGFLYGDILEVNNTDLLWIAGINVVGFVVLAFLWKPLVSLSIHEEIARVEGVPVKLVNCMVMILLAAVFAIAMKLVGVLLITALLIIPAATARKFSTTPENMAIFSSLVGMVSVGMGIYLSKTVDWPAGPAIVVAAFVLFAISFTISLLPFKRFTHF